MGVVKLLHVSGDLAHAVTTLTVPSLCTLLTLDGMPIRSTSDTDLPFDICIEKMGFRCLMVIVVTSNKGHM